MNVQYEQRLATGFALQNGPSYFSRIFIVPGIAPWLVRCVGEPKIALFLQIEAIGLKQDRSPFSKTRCIAATSQKRKLRQLLSEIFDLLFFVFLQTNDLCRALLDLLRNCRGPHFPAVWSVALEVKPDVVGHHRYAEPFLILICGHFCCSKKK